MSPVAEQTYPETHLEVEIEDAIILTLDSLIQSGEFIIGYAMDDPAVITPLDIASRVLIHLRSQQGGEQ